MILGSDHRHHDLTIGKGKKRRFLPFHKLFQYHAGPRFAKFVSGHHILYGSQGLRFGHRHHNAFAGSQAIRFNNDRRAVLFHKSIRGFNIRADFESCCRNIIFFHQPLGKSLGTFQLRGVFIGAEHRQAPGTENIT